ncbi:MAG TPA: immunoglobulin domain-containing protein, partial [Verrucomicrobiae bacterium]
LSPGNSRLELAGRAGGLNAAIDLDNINAQYYANTPNLLAPNECILVVRNRAAFESRYGTNVFRIAGEYGGSLDNGGERLALVGRLGESIFDFNYSDAWYPSTDGYGFSLVRVDPNSPASTLGSASSWRPSGQIGGSPGAVDPAPPSFAPVVINEILTTPLKVFTVELRNPTASNAMVGGWLLLADCDESVPFIIPNGTTIGPGSFLRLDFSPVDPQDFGYCPGGGRLSLFSTDGTNHLTGYVHRHDFGVVDAGVTIGRHVTSVGEDHFVAQAANTLGTNNSLPKVGPLVISEILYRPPDLLAPTYTQDDTFDEFIELRNITASPVNLFHPLYTNNTWRLAKAVQFDFPPNTAIAPQSNILVVAFDPAHDPAFLAAFRARYGIAPGVTIYGPYSGQLDNSSEALELQKPDATLMPGDTSVPHIVVDRVKYLDSAPWPGGADGYGLSLQRKVLSDYGDDPANWVAAVPTPGAGYAGGTAPSFVTVPQDIAQGSGNSVTLTATATGDAPLSYQWRFNGQNLPGETNSILSLSNIQRANSGIYQVAAYNAAGSVLSTGAVLQVLARPAFAQSLTNVTTRPGSNVTFTVAATTDYPPLRFQWAFNGTNISGATNGSLIRTNVQLANDGVYVCAVTDALGLTNLAAATMTVYIAPALGLQPQSGTVLQGADVTFNVSAFGNPPPLSFRWRFKANGSSTFVNLTNMIVTQTNSTYIVANAHPTNSGIYNVICTNVAGSSSLSSSATLTVLADNDHDGMADDWERLYGFSTNNMADAFTDPDMDGMNNYQEYLAGTDPTNGLSYLKIDSIALGGPSANSAVLTFSAVSNHTYTVSFADRVLGGSWASLADFEARTTNRVLTVTNQMPAGVTNRFYRLQTPRLR